jgi:hypothetical protein
MSRLHPLALALVALGLAAAVATLVARHHVEDRNGAVQLVVDYGQLRQLCTRTGTPVAQALVDFRVSGVRGAALTEEVLADIARTYRCTIGTGVAAASDQTRVTIPDAALFDRVRRSCALYLPRLTPAVDRSGSGVRFVGPGRGQSFLVPEARWEDLLAVPLGLDPLELADVRRAGLDPVARVYNFTGVSTGTIAAVLTGLQQEGVRTVIFAGEELLGHPGLLPETAAALAGNGLLYGSVEFGKQRGDEALSERVQDRLVRVHSISAAEMLRMPRQQVIDRYLRAVDERNIRICYLRLFPATTGDPYHENLDYVREVGRQLVREGFALEPAHPMAQVWGSDGRNRAAATLVGVGSGAAGLLLLASLFPVRRRAQLGLTLLFAALGAAAVWIGREKGRQLVALAAALAFPTLGFVWLRQPVGAFESEARRRRRSPGIRALGEFLAMCAISFSGALMVAGALSERDYMLKIDSFAGIKFAHVLPVLVVGLVYLLGLGNHRAWADERAGARGRLRALLAEPIRFWHAGALLVGVSALALLVLRTGNEPGVGVSAVEMQFRTLLEQHLVRPRTKEFLIGHPALILGLALAAMSVAGARLRAWALPLLLVGAIGQVSIVNSFCHLHTPLTVSLWRTANGIWLGALLGMALVGILELALRAGGAGRPTAADRRPANGQRVNELVSW